MEVYGSLKELEPRHQSVLDTTLKSIRDNPEMQLIVLEWSVKQLHSCINIEILLFYLETILL